MTLPVQNFSHVDNLQRSLGRKIRELRTRHGWTQEQLAEFCGLHRTYMGHVERGEKNVSLSTVARVANALGVRIAALFGRPQEATAPEAPKQMRSSRPAPPSGLDVNRLVDELQAQRKAMRQAIRDLSGFMVRLSDSTS
jgi:transcriptional regulator with XRE-family HTH domain